MKIEKEKISHARNHVYTQFKNWEEERIGEERREKREDWLIPYFEETIYYQHNFIFNIYMT